VTFSDAKVAAAVNAGFVAAWHNRGPGFFNDTLSTERWIFESSMEAYPTKNICTFFLTPEGKVFYYVAGYYSPDLFLKFVETASALRGALFDERMQPKAGGLEAARKIHEGRARTMELAHAQARKAESGDPRPVLKDFRTAPTYRGLAHRHGPACVRNLAEGYEYLGLLHRLWAEAKELPELDGVRYGYLWGNPFTEEAATAQRIEGGDPAGEAARLKKARGPALVEAEASRPDTRVGGRGAGVSTGLPSLFGW
jgi:hypothetical protein